ncbi:MAG: 30S ribosomal protein S2 [Tannerellaceae bacterium]|jgi:small subunit ribosomal protein S2|nr:30S ribosomal protein S2 [Tannerellaceae bacterium]
MPKVTFEQLLEAGAHFGHLKRKWNPAMAPYIFAERNGIHVIDLHKTISKLEETANILKNFAIEGKRILFVATKKQVRQVVAEQVGAIGMPYVVERWPGGMLTNFPTIRKAIKKMSTIDKMSKDGTYDNFSKREKLQVTRQRAKLEKMLGSIADMTRLPTALFVVDVVREHIAIREAKRLGIPVFAIVDTNSDPSDVDHIIPANDDAIKSVELIVSVVCAAIKEGLEERKARKPEEEPVVEGEETVPVRKDRRLRVGRKEAQSADLDVLDVDVEGGEQPVIGLEEEE